MTAANELRVRDALRRVADPQAGVNIVDLGLVYGIDISPTCVQVRMTMTRAACPMTELIADDLHEQLAAVLPPEVAIDADLVWEPPWTPERMSQAARSIFGWRPQR